MTLTNTHKIILLRHAESHSNTAVQANVAAWHTASDNLTSQGLTQAHAAAEALKREDVKSIICSNAQRAFETASIMGEQLHMTPLVRAEWKEQEFSKEILDRESLLHIRNQWQHGIDFAYNGGETLHAVWKRVQPLLHVQGTTVVVTHEGVINTVLAYLTHQEPVKQREHKIPYCTGVSIEFKGDEVWFLRPWPEDQAFYNHLPYRETITGIVRHADTLLVLHKKGHPDTVWTLPQGGKHPGETDEHTLQRELHEELQAKVSSCNKILYERKIDWPYEYRGHKATRGQHFRFFVVEITASTVRVDETEIDAAAWVPLEQAIPMLNLSFPYGYGTELEEVLRHVFHRS
jgi:broad specificity phosphatase PhoE/ADP-ribose pyrophosphatase YjhB (NUDIX family)